MRRRPETQDTQETTVKRTATKPPAEPSPAATPEPTPEPTAQDADRPFGRMVIPMLATDLQRIVRRTFDVPGIDEMAIELEAKLRAIKPSRCEYGTLVDALDEAQENARQAMVLFVNAKHAIDRYETDAAITLGAMRDVAMARLQSEKERGQRSKAIAEADITSAIATYFPDEWQAIEHTRSQAKRTAAYLEDLCERMRDRARDLRAMVGTSRA